MSVVEFPGSRHYNHFGELLQELAKMNPDVQRGIVILFDERSAIKVMPVATASQLSYAAACLLDAAVKTGLPE
jgi:hypothetical protein